MKHGVLATVVLATGFVALVRQPIAVTAAQAPAPPSQESIDAGKAAYTASCSFCHGAAAAGGPVGPSLIASAVVKDDKSGELILPIVHGSRAAKGMPKIPIADAKVVDIANWLHTLTPGTVAAPPTTAQATPAPAAPVSPNPRIRGGAADAPPQQQPGRLVAYPDRPKAPDAVLARGRGLYGVNCAFCHGSDAAGGELGPSLIRSSVVLEDQNGELITPIVHGGRIDKGMPRIDITDPQVQDIAAWLHSLKISSRTDPNENNINIVTGDPAAGKVYFQKTCSSCHSVDNDLKGFATRFPVPKNLQQTWMLPGGGGGRGPGQGAVNPNLHVPPVTITVSLPGGKTVEGNLTRIDDFYVGLQEKDGTLRGFDRTGDTPKVVLHDPLAPHRELLHTYTDKEIHDLTAYLVTLK